MRFRARICVHNFFFSLPGTVNRIRRRPVGGMPETEIGKMYNKRQYKALMNGYYVPLCTETGTAHKAISLKTVGKFFFSRNVVGLDIRYII